MLEQISSECIPLSDSIAQDSPIQEHYIRDITHRVYTLKWIRWRLIVQEKEVFVFRAEVGLLTGTHIPRTWV